MPIILSKSLELPDLKDDAIYFAIELNQAEGQKIQHALMEIPSQLNRFVILPDEGKKKYLMLLDDVIRYELVDVFFNVRYA